MTLMELTLPLLETQFKSWKGCPLSEKANPVFGEGAPAASIMFIGEAPGEQEDKTGRPFVGAAGKFLDELLASIDLKREEVYISNVVKYRPPANREPTDLEKEQCMPWLKLQISLIKPKVIVPLGHHALGHFLSKTTISNAHGKAHTLRQAQGDTPSMTIFPIYHPAAALHNGGLRQALFDDFKALGEFLKTLA